MIGTIVNKQTLFVEIDTKGKTNRYWYDFSSGISQFAVGEIVEFETKEVESFSDGTKRTVITGSKRAEVPVEEFKVASTLKQGVISDPVEKVPENTKVPQNEDMGVRKEPTKEVPSTQRIIVRQTSIERAIELGCNKSDVLATAEMLEEWVMR